MSNFCSDIRSLNILLFLPGFISYLKMEDEQTWPDYSGFRLKWEICDTRYITPIISRMVGVSNAVKMPFIVNPRLANAPYLSLTSMALEVPIA